MNVARLCSIAGTGKLDTHQRISDYLKRRCAAYPGIGFSPQIEWIGEQTIVALRSFLQDIDCTSGEREAVERFLELAGEEVSGRV